MAISHDCIKCGAEFKTANALIAHAARCSVQATCDLGAALIAEMDSDADFYGDRLWDADPNVCCAAFQLGACVHTESYGDES